MTTHSNDGGQPLHPSLLHLVKPWLSEPNIVGADIGTKKVGDRDTGEPAIVIHVVRKKAPHELDADDFPIPAQLMYHEQDGDTIVERYVDIDVVETGEFYVEVNSGRVRPCPGGYQIAAANVNGTGTLGVNIVYGGKYRLLTNNHVIANNGNLGANVYQPSASTSNVVGKVSGYTPVTTYPTGNQPNPVYSSHDIAFVDLTPAVGAPVIEQIGIPAGIRAPIVGETVKLMGKQTAQVRQARITSTSAIKVINWGAGRYAYFESMITLDANVTQPGDSGTAYVATSDNMVVGLHVGGGSVSFGCWVYPG